MKIWISLKLNYFIQTRKLKYKKLKKLNCLIQTKYLQNERNLNQSNQNDVNLNFLEIFKFLIQTHSNRICKGNWGKRNLVLHLSKTKGNEQCMRSKRIPFLGSTFFPACAFGKIKFTEGLLVYYFLYVKKKLMIYKKYYKEMVILFALDIFHSIDCKIKLETW